MTAAVGFGSVLVGFVGGAIRQRRTAESLFGQRVLERLAVLEQQVRDYQKRDGYIRILSLGMKMVIPELRRLDAGNPILKHVADIFGALPEDEDTFDELVKQLKEIE